MINLFPHSPTYDRVQELRRWNPWTRKDAELVAMHMNEANGRRPTSLWRL